MTALEWNLGLNNTYETGIDRGVLFPYNEYGVAWSGLVNVDKKNKQTQNTPLYYEGDKFDIIDETQDRTTTVSAYTYPDVLDELLGFYTDVEGFSYGDQPREFFSMAYRTLIGPSDYRINVLINQKAYATAGSHATIGSSIAPTEFSWEMNGVPMRFRDRLVTFMSFDSRNLRTATLKNIENTLYGTKTRDSNFVEFLEYIT